MRLSRASGPQILFKPKQDTYLHCHKQENTVKAKLQYYRNHMNNTSLLYAELEMMLKTEEEITLKPVILT